MPIESVEMRRLRALIRLLGDIQVDAAELPGKLLALSCDRDVKLLLSRMWQQPPGPGEDPAATVAQLQDFHAMADALVRPVHERIGRAYEQSSEIGRILEGRVSSPRRTETRLRRVLRQLSDTIKRYSAGSFADATTGQAFLDVGFSLQKVRLYLIDAVGLPSESNDDKTVVSSAPKGRQGIKPLKPAQQNAGESYVKALKANPDMAWPGDAKELYDWAREHCYKRNPPDIATWKRYVTEYRRRAEPETKPDGLPRSMVKAIHAKDARQRRDDE